MANNFSPLICNQASLYHNYILHDKIGEGANGCIYKATQQSTGQIVALKTIKFSEVVTEQKRKSQIARFEREARLCAGINHPNIVKILDKGVTAANEPFAVFEYVSGITLKEYILQHKGLSIQETGQLMGQVLDALVSTHKIGIVHRDLTPNNIMVSDLRTKKHVKILDFGIGAFTHDGILTNLHNNSLLNDFQGTPAYCAPEQLRGEPPTVKSDFYAWGLIFIECLTGKSAVSAPSITEIIEIQLSSAEVFIPSVIATHPLGKLLRNVLDKKQEKRPENAMELYEKLSAIDLSSLIGKIDNSIIAMDTDYTVGNSVRLGSASNSQKQLTVVCLKLSLSVPKDSKLEMETMDNLQRDHLDRCKETVKKFGGFVVGSLINNLIVYFGYPMSDDADARKAGLMALELISEGNKRNSLLFEQYQVNMATGISIHTGTILMQPSRIPEGIVPNTALNILNVTSPGEVIVSATSKKLLEPFLEFEVAQKFLFSNEPEYIQTFRLIGEQQDGIFSSQKAWRRNREFIGRNDERDYILSIWNCVLEGNGSTIVLSGQAGIGKSRLIYEIQKEIQATGQNVVQEYRFVPEHQNNALYPFFAPFRDYVGITEAENIETVIRRLETILTNAGCNLKESLPLLCLWMSVPLPQGYVLQETNAAIQKKILFHTLKNCLLCVEKHTPQFIIVEDLHWADPISMEFVNYILEDIHQQKYLLMMTSRSEFIYNRTSGYIKQMELQPLTDTFAHHLIINILGGKAIAPSVLDYICKRSDRIPFFIEELTVMLLEQRYLIPEGDFYTLVGDIKEKTVPVTLQALLNARLDKLGLAKETAQLASAIGREFSYDLLAKASMKSENRVQSDLNLMMDADIVYKHSLISGEHYVFRHALIQDAAYGSLTSTSKIKVHLRIAEIIEAELLTKDYINSIDQLERLSDHLFYGKRITDGISRLIEATQITRRQSCNTGTKAICYKALDWQQQIPSTQETKKSELLIRQILISAIMASEGYGNPSIGEELEKVKKLSRELNDNDQLFPARWMQVNYYLLQHDWRSAADCTLDFYIEAQKYANVKWIISSSVMLGQQYFLDGKFPEAEVLLENVLLLYDHNIHKTYTYELGIDQGVAAASILCCVYYFLGKEDKIPALEKQAIIWANNLNHVYTSSSLYFGLCCLQIYKDDKHRGRHYCSVFNTIGSKEQPNMFLPYGLIFEAWVNNEIHEMNNAIDQIEAMGMLTIRSFWYAILAKEELRQGNYLKAQARMLKAHSFIGNSDGNLYISETNRLLGLSYWGLDKKDICKEYLNEARKVAVSQKAIAMLPNIELALDYLQINKELSHLFI
jgi:TOMM system kinase/cyclase fusion protein